MWRNAYDRTAGFCSTGVFLGKRKQDRCHLKSTETSLNDNSHGAVFETKVLLYWAKHLSHSVGRRTHERGWWIAGTASYLCEKERKVGRGLRRTELFLLDSLQSQGRQAAIRIRLPGIHGFSVSVDILRFRTAFTEQDEEVRVYNLPHVQLTVPPLSSSYLYTPTAA